jgi:putative inorganic carbon (HCO3(-)) transporter
VTVAAYFSAPDNSWGGARHLAYGLARLAAAPTASPWTRRLVDAEPLLVVLVGMGVSLQRPGSGLLVLLIPAMWAMRFRVRGVWSIRTGFDGPVALLLALLPLTLLPVAEMPLAIPRFEMVVVGVALVYALANSLTTAEGTVRTFYATVAVLSVGILVPALIVGDWPSAQKLPFVPAIWSWVPVGIRMALPDVGGSGINPNEVGGVLTLLLPLSIATGFNYTGSRSRRLSDSAGRLVLILPFLIGVVILLTQSRSAYVGCVVGGVILFASAIRAARDATRVTPVLAILAGAAVSGAGLVVAALVWVWVSSDQSGASSLSARAELWRTGWLLVWDFPVSGIGMGQLSDTLHALYPPNLTPSDQFVPHVHNLALQAALDLGIPGAIAFLGILVMFFLGLAMAYHRAEGPIRLVIASLGAGVAGYLAFGLTDAVALTARGGIVLWIALGFGAACCRGVRGRRDIQPARIATFAALTEKVLVLGAVVALVGLLLGGGALIDLANARAIRAYVVDLPRLGPACGSRAGDGESEAALGRVSTLRGPAQRALARTQWVNGACTAALETWRNAARGSPAADSAAVFDAARASYAAGAESEAQGLFRELRRGAYLFDLARSVESRRGFAVAEPLYRLAVVVDPLPATVDLLSQRLASLGRDRDALELWREVEQSTTADSPVYWLAEAEIRERSGDALAARAALDRATALSPDPYDLYLRTGRMMARAHSWPAAIDSFTRAVDTHPAASTEPYVGAGDAELQLGRYDAALRWYELGISRIPRDPWPRIAAGRAALGMGDLVEAQRQFEGALAASPDQPLALVDLAVVSHEQGHVSKAISLLERATTVAPSCSTTDLLARWYREIGDSRGLAVSTAAGTGRCP